MPSPTPAVDIQSLRRLLHLLDPQQPCLYGVSRRRRLTRHPFGRLDDLVGWTAPSCWTAAALVAPARAVGPEGVDEITLLHLVARSGRSISGRQLDHHIDLLSEGTGPLDDLCRRIIGLETPPPEGPNRAFLDTLWLDRILAVALDRPLGTCGPSVGQVLALRPDDLDWPAIRLRCAGGCLVIAGITSAQAEWFDDGSFARWAIRLMPDPVEALADLAQLLDGPCRSMLRREFGGRS
ncbi:MAG: hypothetical protein QF367_08270 [Acidimicrobiales bacterium]|jgi:hypothetical protein|nr:hypothetical protein [Acidimicrobiales bacterium]MDP7125239.1 hypothetical protein [Acidimicrobiales bacterium]MDP7352904.1 hypothetical protein [Acidimicrobiales bacterium]MDP7507273.1 hypothetical protein [Acidimicrobiales bacterium]MEE1564125.1 hypothetical protein [Acidimicrobiales bacterium]|tara:strand:+ start:13889 stop:14599 length:711 start_codon:yes stop_codon:yes gene_type:complete